MLRYVYGVILGSVVLSAIALLAINPLKGKSVPSATARNSPVGYSASFSETYDRDPSKNCSGKVFYNQGASPRGFRREYVYSDHQRIMLVVREKDISVVLDPLSKTYWKLQSYGSPLVTSRRTEPFVQRLRVQAAASRYLGREIVNGRQADHWETSEKLPDNEAVIRQEWKDIELLATLKQITPGVSSYTLTNVRIGHQPADLFSIPDGYTEVTPPPAATHRVE